MLFSGGACSRRVSLSLKPFSFPRRCAKLEREREKELGVGRERENFVVVVLFCVECRGREERGKKDFKVFLGNEEKERILKNLKLQKKKTLQNQKQNHHTKTCLQIDSIC